MSQVTALDNEPECEKSIFAPTCCSSSRLPQRSERSEPGAFGYKLDGVDGSLEYDPPDEVDIDRAGLTAI